jgi:exosome complex RNA-binding protein Rrp4
VLTKKYLEKLKQHCDGLERNNGSIYVRQPEKDNNQYRKILELEAENEALRENIVYIKGQHEVEIYNIKLSKESQTNHLALMDKVRELVGKI